MKFLTLAVCFLAAVAVSPGQRASRSISLEGIKSSGTISRNSANDSQEVISALPRPTGDLADSMFTGVLLPQPESALAFNLKLDNPTPALNDECGARVAVSGTTAVMTCHLDDITFTNQGSAYVYVKTGSTWTQQALLTASDAAAGDQFGFSVAIDGDTIVIGAVADDGTFSNQGSVYVFTRTGTVWTQEAKLTAADPAADDLLGWRVDISGNTVVAAAPYDDGTVVNQGSAYVFLRSGLPAVWTAQAKITNPAPVAGDFFAASVAVNGDTVVLGGDGDDVTFTDQGSAYVFVRSGSVWTQQALLTAADAALQDYFGISVDVDGDTVVVGALQDDVSVTDQGSAYVFVRTGTTWTQQTKLLATGTDPTAADLFGWMVSIVGERIAVSAINDDVSLVDQGSVYLYLRTGSVWNYIDRITATDAAAGDLLGCGMGMSPNAVIAGACGDDGAFANQGSSYIFELAPSAADAAVTGRVTSAVGRAISQVRITLTDSFGVQRRALSNTFGYFRFESVAAGQDYVLTADHRAYRFDAQFLSVSDNVSNILFVPKN